MSGRGYAPSACTTSTDDRDRGGAVGSGPPGHRAEWLVFGVGVVLAVVVWALAPSSGNYDTVLDLIWARELLDGTTPGFEAYAASTPHPAWLALGVPVVGIFGDQGDRVMVLISALSLPVLAAATVRLGRIAGEAVASPGRAARTGLAAGLVAGILTLTSFAFLLLAAKGYLDMPFLALVAWAGVGVVTRPAAWRGPAVLLAVAGLLRPEAWLLAGAYWLWCTVRGRWSAAAVAADSAAMLTSPLPSARAPAANALPVDPDPPADVLPGRALHLALVAVAPLLWVAIDAMVTGNPFHSLTATSQLADDLGRERGIVRAPRLLVSQLVDQSRPPVALAGLLGVAVLLLAPRIGLARAPRRVRVVLLALLLGGVVTFLAAGIGGLSLIPRYLSVPVVALTVFAALAATGWVGLPDAHRWRRPWAILVVIGAIVGVGAYLTVKRDSLRELRSELRFLADARTDVRALMTDPAVVRGRQCGPISLPTYRLVPEIRLQLDATADQVVARSDPRATTLGVDRRGVAITVLPGKYAKRYARADGVPRTTQVAPPGFREVARRGAFVASVRCG